VALADADLVDRQETEVIVAGCADFLDEAPLVDLFDGVPRQAEVFGHLFNREIATEVGHGLLKPASGTPKGIEEGMRLNPDPAVGTSDLPVRDEEFHRGVGQAQVPDPALVVAVDGFGPLAAS
jgi:hypothetical protein